MKTIQILTACDNKVLDTTIERVYSSQNLLLKTGMGATVLTPRIITNIAQQKVDRGIQLEPAITPVDQNNYNMYMIKLFARHIQSDYILIIQHDSGIVNSNAWDDEFLMYDYIGCPWPEAPHLRDFFNQPARVGNGGFSLRSAKLFSNLESLSYPYPFPTPTQDFFKEDVHICCKIKHVLEDRGMRFPSMEIASRFGIETPLGDKVRKPFGAHGTFYGFLQSQNKIS